MGVGLCMERFMNRVVEGGSADGCTVQMDGWNGGGIKVDRIGDELTKREVRRMCLQGWRSL